MAVAPQVEPTGELADLDKRLISREIFVSEEIHREELEKVFAQPCFFIGQESHVPKPGEYFVSAMAEELVILRRDRSDKLQVFLNSCMHPGMKVCRYDEVNTPVSPAPITAGATPPMETWWAFLTLRMPTTKCWTSSSGAWWKRAS